MTEELGPASTVIAGVQIAYREQPRMPFGALQYRVDGLMSLFTLLEDPSLVQRRRFFYLLGRGEEGPPFALDTLQLLTAYDIEIQRIRYNPILEIIFGAGVVASGLLFLWERFSKARTAHYEATIKQAEAQMREDDAEIRRWATEAAIQEQIMRAEVAEVLPSRLFEMQNQHLIADGEEDAADRMLSRAVREAMDIERVVPVDEKGIRIKE